MKKNSEGVSERGNLPDKLKECTYCKEFYVASVKNEGNSHFTAYKNQRGWYYYSYCKSCKREYDRLKRKGIYTEEIKEGLREKRELERANRRWSIYLITFDLTGIKHKFKRCHNKYYYVGVTKREPQQRWNEHLYALRKGHHDNEVMQMIYNKIKKAYQNLSEEEYEKLFLNYIIKFEVIETLDNNMSFSEAKLWERFEVKRLEHKILQQIKDKSYDLSISNYELMHLKDDMIINLEHCSSTTRTLKEHKNNSSIRCT